MNKIKLLIADDHNFIIDGIVALLSNDAKFEVIGISNSGKDVIDKFKLLKPDIVIMDISMPEISGIEATRLIIGEHPAAKIIALTQYDDIEYILEFLKAGGLGYILKTANKNELIEAITTVHIGSRYISASVSKILVENLISSNNREDSEKEIPLTKREVEIIKLISDDLTNNGIAEKLNISLRTVETHRRNLMQKLNVKSTVALIRWALQHKIMTIK
ncbi:MAG: response regulator transcription factor [Bacteroidia bacterium]|nr:response regulator transcription factor [Bacteroidia bacterium]